MKFNNWNLEMDTFPVRQYDNLTRRLEVSGDIPDGWSWAALLSIGDNLNIISLQYGEPGLYVDLTADMIPYAGKYNLQLRATQGDKVRHTNIVQMQVNDSMSGDAVWPELPSEFLQAEQRITELNEHPPKPGDNGFWLTWNVETDQYEESDIPLPDISVGPAGPAATVEVAETITGVPGSDAKVENLGTENAAILRFTIPSGPAGPAGTTPQISVTVTTLPAGQDVTVQVSGPAEAPTIAFGIPQGEPGETGPQGLQGIQGWGLSAAELDEDGALVLTIRNPADGQTQTLPPVPIDNSAALQAVAAAIAAQGTTQVQRVEEAGDDAVGAVSTAKDAALEAVGQAKTTATGAVASAQTTAVRAVQGAQGTATTAISQAQSEAMEAVGNKGAEEQEKINAIVPPTDGIPADYLLSVSGWVPPTSNGGSDYETIAKTISVAQEAYTIPENVDEQVVNLFWKTSSANNIPAFENYYRDNPSFPVPRELITSYNQFWTTAVNGTSEKFDASHNYFVAYYLQLDADSQVKWTGFNSGNSAPINGVITNSTWVYSYGKAVTEGQATCYFNNLVGSGRVVYAYAIDITNLYEDDPSAAPGTINDCIDIFGELQLVPGENFEGLQTSGISVLTVKSGDISTSYQSDENNTATIKSGDILSVDKGSVTFMFYQKTYVNQSEIDWSSKKWIAFGDSLTDQRINATQKYYKFISDRTGINVNVMGVGGTGYWRGNEGGSAFYQRANNIPADADVVTIFGSINDWHVFGSGIEIGVNTDTVDANTFCGYVNATIDAAIAAAPFANIVLVSGLYFHGITIDKQDQLYGAIKSVAEYRRVRFADFYHDVNFRIENETFARQFTTDYAEDAETFGHPNNLYHELWLAPAFLELLRNLLW